MGQFTPKIQRTTITMQTFVLLALAAVASASPIADTAEVTAAKAEFKAAFDRAEAGKQIELAPMTPDVQAEPIASAYIADTADAVAAKAEFKAAFDNAAAGGLAAKQAAAPVHEVAAVPAAAPVYYPYTYGLHHGYAGAAVYPYASFPYTYGAYAPYTYSAYNPYANHLGAFGYNFPYTVAPVAAVETEA